MNTGKAADDREDWHPADVVAALRKRGVSLRQLAAQNGYSHIQRVLTSPWLAAEQIVARALGLPPQDIWPSRYRNPADRQRAYELTRKIKVTMPRKARDVRPNAADGEGKKPSRGRSRRAP